MPPGSGSISISGEIVEAGLLQPPGRGQPGDAAADDDHAAPLPGIGRRAGPLRACRRRWPSLSAGPTIRPVSCGGLACAVEQPLSSGRQAQQGGEHFAAIETGSWLYSQCFQSMS